MDYKDIPRFPHSSYEIDVMWQSIEDHLADSRLHILQRLLPLLCLPQRAVRTQVAPTKQHRYSSRMRGHTREPPLTLPFDADTPRHVTYDERAGRIEVTPTTGPFKGQKLVYTTLFRYGPQHREYRLAVGTALGTEGYPVQLSHHFQPFDLVQWNPGSGVRAAMVLEQLHPEQLDNGTGQWRPHTGLNNGPHRVRYRAVEFYAPETSHQFGKVHILAQAAGDRLEPLTDASARAAFYRLAENSYNRP